MEKKDSIPSAGIRVSLVRWENRVTIVVFYEDVEELTSYAYGCEHMSLGDRCKGEEDRNLLLTSK